MMYCPNCGIQVNDKTANFCSACGFQIQHAKSNVQEPAKPQFSKLPKGKVALVSAILAVVAILIAGIIGIIATPISEPTLTRCENLVGAPVEDVLNNEDINISKLLDIRMATVKTDKVFDVSGEIQFIFTVDDEYIDMVTWKSEDNVKLTESEIATFVEGMTKVYGKPEESSKDNDLYFWQTKQLEISVMISDDEISVLFVGKT